MRRRQRRTAAAGLERAIADARHPRRASLGCVVPVCRSEVLMAEPALREIVQRLKDERPVPAYAVARVRAALVDVSSPLYLDAPPGALRDWAHVTLLVLDDGLE